MGSSARLRPCRVRGADTRVSARLPRSLARTSRIDGKYGFVTFEHHGEKIEAADIYKDGYGVRAELKWKGGFKYVTNPGKLYRCPRTSRCDENTTVYLVLVLQRRTSSSTTAATGTAPSPSATRCAAAGRRWP